MEGFTSGEPRLRAAIACGGGGGPGKWLIKHAFHIFTQIQHCPILLRA